MAHDSPPLLFPSPRHSPRAQGAQTSDARGGSCDHRCAAKAEGGWYLDLGLDSDLDSGAGRDDASVGGAVRRGNCCPVCARTYGGGRGVVRVGVGGD